MRYMPGSVSTTGGVHTGVRPNCGPKPRNLAPTPRHGRMSGPICPLLRASICALALVEPGSGGSSPEAMPSASTRTSTTQGTKATV